MKIKVDVERLANTSCNIVLAGILTELTNYSIEAIKRKVKDIKEKDNKETR